MKHISTFKLIALLALTAIALASCRKHDTGTPEVTFTLDGKPYQLKENNAFTGMPLQEFRFGIAVSGQKGHTVSFSARWSGNVAALADYNAASGTGTFTIQIDNVNGAEGTAQLLYTCDGSVTTYYFDVAGYDYRTDIQTTVTVSPDASVETTIPIKFSTTASDPDIVAEFENGKEHFDVVSFTYAKTKASYDEYTGSIVIRPRQNNDTERVIHGGLSIKQQGSTTYVISNINVEQKAFEPEQVDGCIYISDWDNKRLANELADTDGDGEISFEEAAAVRKLDVSSRNLTDMEFLSNFHNLEWLDISYNNDLGDILLDDPAAFSHLKYVRAMFNDEKQRIINASGCYLGPSWKIETTVDEWSVEYDSPKFYQSDPDRAPRFYCVKKHTKGKGRLSLVYSFGLVDADFESGAFEEYVMLDIERIFSVEPYRYFEEYFDVYILEKVLADNVLKESPKFIHYGEVWEKCQSTIYPGEGRGWSVEIANVTSSDPTGPFGGYHGVQSTIYNCDQERLAKTNGTHDGASSILLGEGRRRIINHEYAPIIHELGHALGGLHDQYSSVRDKMPSDKYESNLWTNDDPNEVPWRRFFGIDRYEGRVGIFQHEGSGAYYPSDPQSSGNIMVDCFTDTPYYDSVGRWCIFRNLMFETEQVHYAEEAWPLFLEYDVVNDDLPD